MYFEDFVSFAIESHLIAFDPCVGPQPQEVLLTCVSKITPVY